MQWQHRQEAGSTPGRAPYTPGLGVYVSAHGLTDMVCSIEAQLGGGTRWLCTPLMCFNFPCLTERRAHTVTRFERGNGSFREGQESPWMRTPILKPHADNLKRPGP